MLSIALSLGSCAHERNRGGLVGDAELRVDPGLVLLDGLHADPETRGNLLAGKPRRRQTQSLSFASRESVRGRRSTFGSGSERRGERRYGLRRRHVDALIAVRIR